MKRRFYKDTTLDDLRNYFQLSKDEHGNKLKVYPFDCDIETFKFNTKAKQQSNVDSMMFSLVVFWSLKGKMCGIQYSNFIDFLTDVQSCPYKSLSEAKFRKGKQSIRLYFHNGAGYDHHYILRECKQTYPITLFNWVDDHDHVTKRAMKSYKLAYLPNYTVLEKRIKAKSKLNFIARINDTLIETCDTYLKTGCSLKKCGKMLKNAGLITKNQMKTTLQYDKYDLKEEPEDIEAYRQHVFEQLDEEEMTYIWNDGILQHKLRQHYSQIFYGFEWSNTTKTQGIIKAYDRNSDATYQIKGKVLAASSGKKKSFIDHRYSEFSFGGENLAEFLGRAYYGGLNFYNDRYIGRFVSDCFSFDRNSSYPDILYRYDLPWLLTDFQEEPEITHVDGKIREHFCLYEITKHEMNRLLSGLRSTLLKKAFVKYYNKSGKFTVIINTWTIALIEKFGVSIPPLKVLKSLTFNLRPFGGREALTEFYQIKTQGKFNHMIDTTNGFDPSNIRFTDEINSQTLPPELVYICKVNLNGIYGAPALRPSYPLAWRDDRGSLNLLHNGHDNTERNVLTSLFTTAGAFFGLMDPLTYVPQEKIDEWFVYADTDSIYAKKEMKAYLPESLFHPCNLGKWDIEHADITEMYVLNHKKYALVDPNEKDPIVIRCGGVQKDSFDTNMDFHTFVETQFSDDCQVPTTRSLFNFYEVPIIYEGKTKFKQGIPYPAKFRLENDQALKKIIQEIREENELAFEEGTNFGEFEDLLYIETPYGQLSLKDIYPHDYEGKHLSSMQVYQSMMIDYQHFLQERIDYE